MAMTLVERASELAERTPERRNRYADLLRVTALGMVVVGHWLVIDVDLSGELPVGRNALGEVSWAPWLTWVFQVIPVVFLVGGYANAASWRSNRRRQEGWAAWLHRRALRLLWPTAVFVAFGAAVTPMAAALDVPASLLDQASWAVAIILWFLAVYLGVAALTPVTLRAHDRGPWLTLGGLAGFVAIADLMRFAGGFDIPALANYGVVWAAFHQVGFLWHDDRLPGRQGLLGAIAAVAALLVALVATDTYPLSMVGVPGAEVQNTGPPNLALLAFGLTQIGLVLLIRDAVKPKLRGRTWTVVVGANLVAMSVFLWHVVPVAILTAGLWWLDIVFPAPIGSGEWLAFRLAWVALLAMILAPVVMVLSRIERPPERLEDLDLPWSSETLSLGLGLGGIAGAAAGIARLTLEGFRVDSGAIPVWGLAAFFGGFLSVVMTGGLLRDSDRYTS